MTLQCETDDAGSDEPDRAATDGPTAPQVGGVFPGRWTARAPEGTAVFLIGMRFGHPWAVAKWAPVFVAMPRMLAYLQKRPETGMLGSHLWFGRTTILLSYWRSAEHLRRFAADPQAPHLGPWRQLGRRLANDPAVGIWHETYLTGPGSYEAIYANMPAFGLAGATEHLPVTADTTTARRRFAGAARGPARR